MNKNKNSDIKIQKITFETYIHETEDPEKVKTVFQALLPPTQGKEETLNIIEKKIMGHWKNTILSLKVEVSGKKCSEVFQRILKELPQNQKEIIISKLDAQFDEPKMMLYIRLNKQSLISGRMQLLEGSDVIRIAIKFLAFGKKSERTELIKNYLQNCFLGEKANG
ncbi:MAG: RNA-binding domain-containing protein [Candidatus Hermodarchaeota archaeon]